MFLIMMKRSIRKMATIDLMGMRLAWHTTSNYVHIYRWQCVKHVSPAYFLETVGSIEHISVVRDTHYTIFPMGQIQCKKCGNICETDHTSPMYCDYNDVVCGNCTTTNCVLFAHDHPHVMSSVTHPWAEEIDTTDYKEYNKHVNYLLASLPNICQMQNFVYNNEGMCLKHIREATLARRVLNAFRANVIKRRRARFAWILYVKAGIGRNAAYMLSNDIM